MIKLFLTNKEIRKIILFAILSSFDITAGIAKRYHHFTRKFGEERLMASDKLYDRVQIGTFIILMLSGVLFLLYMVATHGSK